MEIHRDRMAGKLYISQKKYLEKVLDRFHMSDCKSVTIPLAAHFKLSSDFKVFRTGLVGEPVKLVVRCFNRPDRLDQIKLVDSDFIKYKQFYCM